MSLERFGDKKIQNIEYDPTKTSIIIDGDLFVNKQNIPDNKHGQVLQDIHGRLFFPIKSVDKIVKSSNKKLESFSNKILDSNFLQKIGAERRLYLKNVAKIQIAFSRLIKGILNVADVVEYKGKYYSVFLDHSKIQKKESIEEFFASEFLLFYIFHNYDRHFNPHNVDLWNSRYEYEVGSHYDLESRWFMNKEKTYRKFFNNSNIKSINYIFNSITERQKEYLRNKLELFIERFNDRDFVKKIMNINGFKINTIYDLTEDSFIDLLLNRCQELLSKINNYS